MIKMTKIVLFSLILVLCCLNYGNTADLPQEKGPDDEKLAGIALGDSSSMVVKLLGEAEKKTGPVEEPATGYKIQHYIYKSKGIDVSLDLYTNTVIFVAIESPCEEGTIRGVKIGDPFSKVKNNYILTDFGGNSINSEADLAGKTVYCGDIYWGIQFVFDEAGKVKSISMGAFAE